MSNKGKLPKEESKCTCYGDGCEVCMPYEEDVIDYWVSKKKLMEKEKKEKIMVVDDEGYIVRTVDYMLNNFANYLLTNNIKLRDSNQIAQVIIDYLKQMV